MEEPMMSNTRVDDVVPDVLVLAAVDRAERHRRAKVDPPGVPVWGVFGHLGVAARSRRARTVRERLDELVATGALERLRRHGTTVWSVTRAGRRRLSRARRAGRLPVLPESPQHRAWREARELAGERIDGFRVDILEELEHAGELLDADIAVAAGRVAPEVLGESTSDAWFEVAERLQHACRRLGSASYCLWEWQEPDDARADVDDHSDPCDRVFDGKHRDRRFVRRHGRRNTRLWDRDAELVFLGQAIREIRERQDISPAELAGKAGIRERRLARVEAGAVDPDYELLCKLVDALNVESHVLMNRVEALEQTDRPR
jgi:ribosome-binding protein aMBF1 (putative translation factor)